MFTENYCLAVRDHRLAANLGGWGLAVRHERQEHEMAIEEYSGWFIAMRYCRFLSSCDDAYQK